MRIIAGEKKGLNLNSPKGDRIRPTSDKIRGAIFSSLYSYLGDEPFTFIDCFGGTGAMSIEALSRGAKEVYLIDKNRKSIALIQKNLDLAGYRDRVELFKTSAKTGLERLGERGIKADVIFMDPPYKELDLIYILFDKIETYHLLSPSGIIVIEHDKHDTINKVIKNFVVFKEKTYANTTITFLKLR